MKQKLLHYTKEIIYFVLFMTLFANALSWYKSQDLNKKPLPLITAKSINKTSHEHTNKNVTVVHFWATWCPTCKLEASNINRLNNKADLITIAVNSGSDDTILKYLQENNLSFEVINDSNGTLAKEFGITAYPTTLIYDKEKNLIFSDVGYTSTIGLLLRVWWVGL